MDPTELNNQEDTYGQPGGEQPIEDQQAAPVVEETASAAEPEDLAAAFAALRGNDQKPAQTAVATGEAGQQPGAEQPAPVQQQQYQQPGDNANDSPRIDWAAKRNEAIDGARRFAIAQVRQQWQEQGRRALTIDELARKDEQTGEIYYINLDDDPSKWNQPGYRGVSRSVARERMKEFNEDLQTSWNNEVRQATIDAMNTLAPYQRMIDFGPVYEKMPKDVQDIMDRLTAPYAIVAQDGTIAGYNVDLIATARQAIDIAQMYRQANPAAGAADNAQTRGQVRTPALDSNSSAGGQRRTSAQKDPTDISDAIAMFEQMQRDQRKADKK